jgi:hypothetical protein
LVLQSQVLEFWMSARAGTAKSFSPGAAGLFHTNLGAGSGLQNKREPANFNYALGAFRLASLAANTGRWDGEIPVADKSQYREPGVAEAFWAECMASDPTSNTRTPPRPAVTCFKRELV